MPLSGLAKHHTSLEAYAIRSRSKAPESEASSGLVSSKPNQSNKYGFPN